MGRDHRFLEGVEEETDPAILSAFLVRYYVPAEARATDRAPVPARGLGRAARAAAASEWLVPQRGTAHRWLELADHNARHLLESLRIESFETEERAEDPVYALGRDLGLSSVPRSMICIDISHNQGKDTVGSLVWFEAGRPRKAEYRKFKIQGLGQQDDFAAIQEVLTRYLTRRRDENQPLPDLFLIDGGKGQLHAAMEASEQLGFTGLQFASLAKREEEVFLPGQADPPATQPSQPIAETAAADPGRGAPLRTGLQPEAAHPAHDHLRAAQHSGCRSPSPTALAGAVRQPRRREVGLGLRARHGARLFHPTGGAGPRASPDPGLSLPELPDVVVYLEALERRILGRALGSVRLLSPFVLRTVEPPITALYGRRVLQLRRMGKRIVLGFEDDLFLVIHLMIAGRLRWGPPGAKAPGKIGLAAFDFDGGTLLLTEAGSKRRASLHVVARRGGAGGASSAAGWSRWRRRVGVRRAAPAGEPHAQARPHRSAALQRHRQRLLRRDPAPGAAVAAQAHRPARPTRRSRGCTRPPARCSRIGPSACGARRAMVSREGDRVQGGDGGARPVRTALSRVRDASPADPLRGERDQLLPQLPDGGPPARRPRGSPGC